MFFSFKCCKKTRSLEIMERQPKKLYFIKSNWETVTKLVCLEKVVTVLEILTKSANACNSHTECPIQIMLCFPSMRSVEGTLNTISQQSSFHKGTQIRQRELSFQTEENWIHPGLLVEAYFRWGFMVAPCSLLRLSLNNSLSLLQTCWCWFMELERELSSLGGSSLNTEYIWA